MSAVILAGVPAGMALRGALPVTFGMVLFASMAARPGAPLQVEAIRTDHGA